MDQLTHQANAPRLVRRPRRARMAALQRMRLELRNQQLEQENSALKQELQRTQRSLILAKEKRTAEREFHQGNEVDLREFIEIVDRALEVPT